MNRNFILIICLFILTMLSGSCREPRNPWPISNCSVSIMIDISSFDNEFSIGWVKTFDQRRGWAGCLGVVVYRFSADEFYAYDMACPNDHYYGCTVIKHNEPTMMAQPAPEDMHFQCSCCNVKFNMLTGHPQGSTYRYPMRKYTVTPQGNGRFLVHN